MAYYRLTSTDDPAAEPGRRAVPLRGGAGAVVALVALKAALAWDLGRESAGAAGGFTKLNNPYTQAQEVDR